MKIQRWYWVLLMPLILATPVVWADSDQSPRDVVKASTERLVAALKQHQVEIQTDRPLAESLAETHVLPHIDFERVNQLVLGRHWEAATPDQRERFTRAFRRLLMSVYVTAMVTYADRIIANSQHIFFPPGEVEPQARAAMVRMLIDLPSGFKTEADFRMYRGDTDWKVYDVIVGGVSIGLIYRTMFASQVANKGLDDLIAALEAKIRRNDSALTTAR